MTQTVVLKPLGLITQPNKFGVYPEGALTIAAAVRMRDPGSLEASQVWSDLTALSSSNSNAAVAATYLVYTDGPQSLYLYRSGDSPEVWTYQWINTLTGATTFAGTVSNEVGTSLATGQQFISLTGQTQSVSVNTRVVMQGRNSVLVFDNTQPASGAQAAPRQAGMVPVQISAPINEIASGNSTTGAILPDKGVHYTTVLRRTLANGDILVSAPCAAVFVQTNGDVIPQNTSLEVYLNRFTKTGDVVEVYRTKAQTYTGVTAVNTGSDYFLAATYTVRAADSKPGLVSIPDTAPDTSLGAALYTNQGIQGASAAATPPLAGISCCQYKGHTFTFGYTEPPQFAFRVPVFWGRLYNGGTMNLYARKNGIGDRQITGTAASGNPTITAIAAGETTGVVAGQRVTSGAGNFVGGSATVLSATATSITFSANLNTSGSVNVTVVDVMEIDGVSYSSNSADQFVSTVALATQAGTSSNILVPQNLARTYNAVTSGGTSIQEVTVPADNLVISRWFMSAQTTSITVRATNGANYVPRFPEINETPVTFAATTSPNGVAWSEQNQPENCPVLNTLPCGSGEIYRAASTRDAIYIFASDGLWRLSGTGGSAGDGYDWRIDPVDSTISLAGPRACTVLRDTVYAYTSRGVVQVDSAGNVNDISHGRLNDILPGPGWPRFNVPTYNPTTAIVMAADETNDEIMLRESGGAGSGSSNLRVWIYNTLTDTYVHDTADGTYGVTDLAYSKYSERMFVACAGILARVIRIQAAGAQYQGMAVKFQNLYGDPFVLRRWQQFDIAFDAASAVTVDAYCNNNTSIGTATRTAAFATSGPQYSRTSFGVPISAPAIANAFAPGFNTLSTVNRVKLIGFAVKFVDFTEDRKAI